jgi:hypothetical protein
VSLWGFSLPAQEPAPAETPATQAPETQAPEAAPTADQRDADQRDKALRPLTPEQVREQLIRQYDPLDRSDDQAAKAQAGQEKDRDQRKSAQTDTPLPGSIAA